jgi:transcriptional regulator with XRE-family HTH domain
MTQHLAELLDEIIAAGKRQGKTQAQLVAQAGLGAATLSRAKQADDVRYSTLERLAKTVGLRLGLVPDEPLAARVQKGELFE